MARRFLPLLLLAAVLLAAACGDGAQPASTRSPSAPAPASPSSPEARALAIAGAFDSRDAQEIVETLADPSFMGRHVGTPGELKGARFLADAFESAGLDPGGDDGSFLQTFSLEVQELASTPALELTGPSGETRSLRLRDDFRPIVGGSAGGGDVQGPAVFGGTGEDLSGLEIAGKVLMVTPRSQLADILRRARREGALAVIVTTGQETLLKGEARPPEADTIPVARVSQNGAAILLEGSGHTRAELNADIEAGRPLPTFPLTWTAHLAVSLLPPADVEAHNVIGILPGTAAGDAARTVVVGGHYEEIGPDPDGVVFPAANDNASGTAVLLELARLLQESDFQPSASIVFVAWSGHEEGLFGSNFYIGHAPLPLSDTVLYLNLDTVGQGASPSLDGFVSDDDSRKLLSRALDLLRDQGEPAPVEISDSPEGVSDDVNFVDAGVPSVTFVWGGIFEDGRIHTTEDTAETVDVAKLEVTGRVSAVLLVLVALR